jgi:hypothetical protein
MTAAGVVGHPFTPPAGRGRADTAMRGRCFPSGVRLGVRLGVTPIVSRTVPVMSELNFVRRTWMTLEPIHGMVYFSPLQEEFYGPLGLEGREGYFASRSAAMGAASPELVASTFFNFAPGVVNSAIPSAWGKASPETILDARHRLVDATLSRLVPEHYASDATKQAAVIAAAIARDAVQRVEGRPLFAAHASLPWPDPANAALTLWHAQTLLREFRGDGHIAVLVAEGLSGVDAHVTHLATGQMPVELMRATRAWPDEAFDASVQSLIGRGLVTRENDGTLHLTEAGVAQRQHIEDRTDELAAPPYHAAGDERCAELRRAARPLSQGIVDAGLSPLRRLPPPSPDHG